MYKFTGYDTPRRTRIYDHLYALNDKYAILCRICGCTFGQHGGTNICPNTNLKQVNPASGLFSSRIPEFPFNINELTKVI